MTWFSFFYWPILSPNFLSERYLIELEQWRFYLRAHVQQVSFAFSFEFMCLWCYPQCKFSTCNVQLVAPGVHCPDVRLELQYTVDSAIGKCRLFLWLSDTTLRISMFLLMLKLITQCNLLEPLKATDQTCKLAIESFPFLLNTLLQTVMTFFSWCFLPTLCRISPFLPSLAPAGFQHLWRYWMIILYESHDVNSCWILWKPFFLLCDNV